MVPQCDKHPIIFYPFYLNPQIFYEDDSVLTISLHQDGNYPLHSGSMEERGTGKGEGFSINVPLPPGGRGPQWQRGACVCVCVLPDNLHACV